MPVEQCELLKTSDVASLVAGIPDALGVYLPQLLLRLLAVAYGCHASPGQLAIRAHETADSPRS